MAPPQPERVHVIQTVQALFALRDSGYSLSTALAEVVDNSIEAGARNIDVVLNEAFKGGKGYVDRISIVDDGIGMAVETLARYLVIGFSTRWMRTDTIGKYGVGAKLAALNFGLRIDVWSRQSANEAWHRVELDLGEMLEAEKAGNVDAVTIAPPRESAPPLDIVPIPPKGAGTIVVWSEVDRLEVGRVQDSFENLVADARKELARIFREFISGGVQLSVNKRSLLPFDPLFLMSGTLADDILTSEQTGKELSDHFAPKLVIADREEIYIKEAGASAYLTVTLAPGAVLRKRYKGGDDLARKLGLTEAQGVISFVRRKREISYTVVPRILPGGIKDTDRFIGIEVSFDPELDQYFGVRNVKRGVEPHGEVRNRIRQLLKGYIGTARKALQEHWREEDRKAKTSSGEHENVVDAASEVDKGLPQGRVAPLSEVAMLQMYRDLAKDVGHDDPAAIDKYVERVSSRPFAVETVDVPGKTFIDITYLGGSKIIVRVNKRHKFYREIWAQLKQIADGGVEASDELRTVARRATDGLTLMVIAYARATAMEDDPEIFEELSNYWGVFLDTMMSKVTSAEA